MSKIVEDRRTMSTFVNKIRCVNGCVNERANLKLDERMNTERGSAAIKAIA